MTIRSKTLLSLLCGSIIIATVLGQDMQPRVYITETDPPSVDLKMRGFLAKDVWLNCYVENMVPELTVRWDMYRYKKGEAEKIPISIDMAVEDNNKWSIEKPTEYSWRLRVKALQLHDEGNYTCYVILTANNNRAEANRTVFVTDPPLILEAESSSDVSAKEGDQVSLRCNASGRPLPTMMWRRQGNAPLPEGGVQHIGSLYTIDDIQYHARGQYICEAFNEVGQDRRDIRITVQHAPKVTSDPDEVGQAVGYQRTMVCHIEANPVPSTDTETNQLYWIFDGVERVPPDDERRVNRVLEGAFGRLTNELVMTRVEGADYGTYECVARNNIGSSRSTVTLYETVEPVPDKQGKISLATHLRASLMTSLFCLIFILLSR